MASEGISRETQMSIEASSMFPGFRFSPTDVELISYYLNKKLEGYEKCVEVIPEIEICRHEPWDLPEKSVIKSDNEWFFFCARGRKYPNGSQSRRATEQGYWKATGKERNVKSGNDVIGTKRTLVFHTGRAPKGERTEWIMHEYCMDGKSQDSLVVCRLRKNGDFRLNNTSNRAPRNPPAMHDSNHATSDVAADQTVTSEGDKVYLKKGTCSYDSQSIEQCDSVSESEQKLSNDVGPTASSTPQKDSDAEEDYFAEILKDDIIKLDETPLSSRPDISPTIACTSNGDHGTYQSRRENEPRVSHFQDRRRNHQARQENEPHAFQFQDHRRTHQARQENEPRVSHFQGTANRRIKLRKPKADDFVTAKASTKSKHGFGEISIEKLSSPNSGVSPKWFLSLFSPSTPSLWLIYATIVILILLALFLTYLGGFESVKNFRYMLLC